MTQVFSLFIVDDNARIRATIRSIVGPIADHVVECVDGLEAVERYADERPDWVLMDVSMPRLDGISAARRIRDVDPGARIIMVTDYDDPKLRRAAADAGVVAYVGKDDLFALLAILVPPPSA
jgi:CheY-like chemotaxis protein